MSKAEPIIQKYMTYQPNAIESSESLEEASKMMSELQIRHLPVMEQNKVVGVISDRDIKSVLSIAGVFSEKTLIKDICHENPYQVSPDTPLHEVVDEMAEKHYGCALVIQNENLVGVFTTVDVCKTLSELLQQRFHSQS